MNICRGVPLLVLGLILVGCGERRAERGSTSSGAMRSPVEPVHITMDALHQAGGIPPGWRLTPPLGDPAEGRRAFVELGCHSCHAVRGESFSPADDATHVGPELSGMGSHHPAAYFVESIINPDAVLVDGSGYVAEDGHSRMPAYPDMTLAQLADLVAYLQSLTESGTLPMPAPASALLPRPSPPPSEAGIFFVQVYDVRAGQLAAFEQWFQSEGAPALRAVDGLLSIDTYVDNTRPSAAIVTQMAFRNDAALSHFLSDPRAVAVKQRFDDFIGPHGHQMFRTPPVYRAASLSAP